MNGLENGGLGWAAGWLAILHLDGFGVSDRISRKHCEGSHIYLVRSIHNLLKV